MINILLIIGLLAVLPLAGCAEKHRPFDPVAAFKEAEDHMKDEDFLEARKKYQEIQEKSPDRSYDANIMLRIADTYFGGENYDEALVEYRAFLKFHPVNKNAAYAQYQIAMCSFKQLPTIDRDPAITRMALREFETLIKKYPKSRYGKQAKKNAAICRDVLAQYELYVARFYFKKGAYGAAIGRLEKLLRDFPASMVEKDALYYSGLAYREIGEEGKALRVFTKLVKKYPSAEETVGSIIKELRQK